MTCGSAVFQESPLLKSLRKYLPHSQALGWCGGCHVDSEKDRRSCTLEGDVLRVTLNACAQDYGALLRTHRENNADITIATHSVGWKQASLRGITRVDSDGGFLLLQPLTILPQAPIASFQSSPHSLTAVPQISSLAWQSWHHSQKVRPALAPSLSRQKPAGALRQV